MLLSYSPVGKADVVRVALLQDGEDAFVIISGSVYQKSFTHMMQLRTTRVKSASWLIGCVLPCCVDVQNIEGLNGLFAFVCSISKSSSGGCLAMGALLR